MGAGLAVPLLISGAATGAQVLNQDAAQRRADRITAAGLRQQGVRQREANARVDQEIERVAGSDPAMEQQAANAQYMEQLRRSRAAARGITGVPGASSRYNEDVLAGNAAVDANAARVADLMSRVNAPLLQRDRETQGLDRLRNDVGVIGRAAEGDAFLNRLRLQRVRANPWVDALAGIAQGYASARALGALNKPGWDPSVVNGPWELPTDVTPPQIWDERLPRGFTTNRGRLPV